jgi:hypothetical protein
LPEESWDVLGNLGPYPTQTSALEDIEEFRQDPNSLLIAVIDKQVEGKGRDGFAGVYGITEYSDEFMVSTFLVLADSLSLRCSA